MVSRELNFLQSLQMIEKLSIYFKHVVYYTFLDAQYLAVQFFLVNKFTFSLHLCSRHHLCFVCLQCHVTRAVDYVTRMRVGVIAGASLHTLLARNCC